MNPGRIRQGLLLLAVGIAAGGLGFYAGQRLANAPRRPADAAPAVPEVVVPPVTLVTTVTVETVDQDRVDAYEAEADRLRQRIADLEAEETYLTSAVAAEKMEGDRLRAEQARRQASQEGPAVAAVAARLEGLAVIDADEATGLVAVAGGRDRGLRVGLRFYVMRDDRQIAVIRLAEVRQDLSGAFVEDNASAFPRKGDRLIPVRTARR